MSFMNIKVEILNKIPSDQIQQHSKGLYMGWNAIYPRNAKVFQHESQSNVRHHVNRIKGGEPHNHVNRERRNI